VSVRTAPRHRKVAPERTGGASGNEKLTAMTGAVLLVLLAAEGVTLVSVHHLLTLHFFLGFLLIGPVLLKLGSTGYRFTRYYTRSAAYVRKGPPALLLRLLGPVVIATSVGVIGSGVGLAFAGPRPWLLLAHKASFVLWFGAMTIHVLWYSPRLPGMLASRPARDRARLAIAGAGARWLLVSAALGIGLIVALATYHLAGSWAHLSAHAAG
jgi:hypothetical protein